LGVRADRFNPPLAAPTPPLPPGGQPPPPLRFRWGDCPLSPQGDTLLFNGVNDRCYPKGN